MKRNDSLSPVSRLKANSDFQRVRREGRSWSHPLIVLIARANGLAESRFGVVAGKTVGGAVKRNRAKRRLWAALRLAAGALNTGWDVVLIARPGLPDAEWLAITGALAGLLKRAGIVKDG